MVRSSISLENLDILRKITVKSIINPTIVACSATRFKAAILKRAAVERKNKKRLASNVSFLVKNFSSDQGKELATLWQLSFAKLYDAKEKIIEPIV